MKGNALITGCYSRTNGGGIMLAAGNPQDSFLISGQSQIDGNQGANGGGIWFSGFRDENSAASVLTLADNALISQNQAVNGAGIYYYSSNDGDRLAITESASITGNTASPK